MILSFEGLDSFPEAHRMLMPGMLHAAFLLRLKKWSFVIVPHMKTEEHPTSARSAALSVFIC